MELMQADSSTLSYEECSLPYIGRWTRLVSTTNWDKGQIIHQWRLALIAADAPATEFSDEVWSRRVGGVSPQHVGRLRRVHDRFSDIRSQFAGLFWSHYQAALDWDDAEMWLEGATQNDWSVAQMRQQRWEATGGTLEVPADADARDADLDEDAELSAEAEQLPPESVAESVDHDQEPRSPAGPDFGDEDDVAAPPPSPTATVPSAEETLAALRPFDQLPELPDDVLDAFEAFKVCIIRHKADDWRDMPLAHLLQTLDALKQFAVASA